MTKSKKWVVSGVQPNPDGYNDQGYWEGDSFWGAVYNFLTYKHQGWVVDLTYHP
jgi:hypothetical protein